MIVCKLLLSMYQNLLSYSFIIVHLGHFQYFAIINTTVVNLMHLFQCKLLSPRVKSIYASTNNIPNRTFISIYLYQH